ncbi:MAG: CocE/NonD family hydrolase [Lactimicrobium sp.]|jgi:esterase/lipase|uniref:CocE/NonD family hydrolase n=1 Tax=Lactimicrobium sp. TaxID=2563780 RepID=UPI002F34EF98
MKPVFENGIAMPVFPFTDGRQSGYTNADSSILRFCVYVETDYDTDMDGRRDRVKALVQVPRAAMEGDYKAPVIYEARPYIAGTRADSYEAMKRFAKEKVEPLDFKRSNPDPTIPSKTITSLVQAENAEQSDWYYEDPLSKGAMCYEDLDWYDSYLVRGYAVVSCAGLGTRGSEGFNGCGMYEEKMAFASVIQWLHGDRNAYTSLTSDIAVTPEWCSGIVGMTGRSYGGTMPYAIACEGINGLKTIVPVAGIADWYSFLNQQGAQRYWPKEMTSAWLDLYCMSSLDEQTEKSRQDKAKQFLDWRIREQAKDGFDYGPYWEDSNYYEHSEKLNCSALIIHGLNDENVSTKQAEMMYDSFKKHNLPVSMILHQGHHMTPDMPAGHYGMRVDGKVYDDLVNAWFSKELFGTRVEKFPTLLVQNCHDGNRWDEYPEYFSNEHTDGKSAVQGYKQISSLLEKHGVNAHNYEEKLCLEECDAAIRLVSAPLAEDVLLKGSAKVTFDAALTDLNPDFAKNVSDADDCTFALGKDRLTCDDLKLTVMLADVSEEPFDSFMCHDDLRTEVETALVKENGIDLGGGFTLDEKKLVPTHKCYKVFARGYLDLCNPDAGYLPSSAQGHIALQKNEMHTYTAWLNPDVYTVEKHHHLVVLIATEDPCTTLVHKDYQVLVDQGSIKTQLPGRTGKTIQIK